MCHFGILENPTAARIKINGTTKIIYLGTITITCNIADKRIIKYEIATIENSINSFESFSLKVRIRALIKYIIGIITATKNRKSIYQGV